MTNTNSETMAAIGMAPAVSRNDVLDAVMYLARMAQGLADAHALPGLSVAIVHRDELVLLAGESFSLRHFDGHVFVYHPYDETPQLPVAATFEIGPDHQATRLTLDDLNDNGQGVLVRARS